MNQHAFRRSSARSGLGRIVLVLAVLAASATSSARADISFLDAFRNLQSQQTGNGNTLSPNVTFYDSILNTSIPNSYTSVTMTYPGPGSPLNIPQETPTTYHSRTTFANQGAMDAAFPFGTYTFKGVNGATTDTANYQYTSDDYAKSTPFLTGTDFTSLQGMNATQPFTFHFSPFITGAQASSSNIFLTIFDLDKSGSIAYSGGFLAPTTTSVTVAANTLTPGHHFVYDLIFDNRDTVPGTGATFSPFIGFDTRTDGTFTAAPPAIPEPSVLALFTVAGAVGGTVSLWRRRRAG